VLDRRIENAAAQIGIADLFVPHVGSRAWAIALDCNRVQEFACHWAPLRMSRAEVTLFCKSLTFSVLMIYKYFAYPKAKLTSI
jgi:hypothetical protein